MNQERTSIFMKEFCPYHTLNSGFDICDSKKNQGLRGREKLCDCRGDYRDCEVGKSEDRKRELKALGLSKFLLSLI